MPDRQSEEPPFQNTRFLAARSNARDAAVILSARFARAALAAALLTACGKPVEGDSARPRGGDASPTVPVVVAEAVTRRVETRLDQVGTLRSGREVTVRSEAGGTVIEILFAEGGSVRRGEVLARLDARKLEAEILRLEAQLLQLTTRAANRRRDLERNQPLTEAEVRKQEERVRQLAARLANRRRDLERNRDMLARELVSRQSFDTIETEIEEGAAELAQAEIELARQSDLVAGQSADRVRTDLQETEAEIAQARATLVRERARLADATIRAPFDGVAGTRQVNVGDFVAAGGGIVTLVDLDPLEIAFSVPEKHKERLAVGLPVHIGVDAYADRTFAGAISYVSPRVDEQTRAFPVKAEVGNAEGRLNPGMFARVAFVTGVRESALTVPAEALIPAEGASSLFVVEGDKARKVPVRPGESVDGWVEVLDSGLAPGAQVIVEGKFALRDGARVLVQP